MPNANLRFAGKYFCCFLYCSLAFFPGSAQIITTIAGSGVGAYGGDGAPATAAGCTPFDLRVDPAGNIFFSDRLNQRIRKVNTAGIISTYAGLGPVGYSGDGGPATAAKLNVLNGVTFDLSGNYLIADGPNNRIRKVDAAGIISTIAGTGPWGSAGDGGPATLATIADAYGVAVDYSGNVYIADSYYNRIRKINAAGIITNFAGNGSVGFSGDGGPATNAQLSWPTGIAFDHYGNTYITDDENNRIRKIDPAGIITTIAGSGTVGTVPGAFTGSYSGDGGPATAATLNTPVYLTLDNCGNIYFPDYGNNCVRKIDAAGIITTIGGTGVAGFGGDGGPATAARMYVPTGIAIDNSGNIIFADQGNNRVRKITTSITPATSHRDTTVCSGTPVTLSTTAPGTHLWSTGATTSSITVTSAGTYWVMSSSIGCGPVADTTHVHYGALSVSLGRDTTFCSGNSLALSPSAPSGSTYIWSTGATGSAITISATGTYWVSVSDGGCVGKDTINITVNPRPVVNLGPDQNVCPGTTVTLQPAATYTAPSYLWSTGSTTRSITAVAAGTYWLRVTVAGCSATDSMRLMTTAGPIIKLRDTSVCPGASVMLGSPEPPGATYLWSTGSTDSAILVTPPHTYSLTVSLNGCKTTAVMGVNLLQLSSISLGNDTTLCVGDAVVLDAGNNAAIWNTKQQGATIKVTEPGMYSVTIHEPCGTIHSAVSIAFEPCDIGFPSAFTPNDDGLNDDIGPVGTLSKYSNKYTLSIYNRWGQCVFTTNDIYKKWDGIFMGTMQDMGTFFYMMEYTFEGRQHRMKGDFHLIR